MPFGFGHLVSVMSTMHPQVAGGIIEARLKHLQRLPFPSEGPRVGKGGRTYYSVDEMLKVAFALELLASGIVATHGAALVRDRWDAIADGFAEAWAHRSVSTSSLLLVVHLEGFDAPRGGTGTVELRTLDAVLLDWKRRDRKGRDVSDRRATLVDLMLMSRGLEAALAGKDVPFDVLKMRRDLDDWVSDRRTAALPRTGT